MKHQELIKNLSMTGEDLVTLHRSCLRLSLPHVFESIIHMTLDIWAQQG